jgi:hypothetical protein
MKKLLAPLLASMALSSCNVVSIDLVPGQVVGVSGTGKYELELKLSAQPQDVYFVFTNPSASAKSLPAIASSIPEAASRGWIGTDQGGDRSGDAGIDAQDRADAELRRREALLPQIERGGAASRGEARSRALPDTASLAVGSSQLSYLRAIPKVSDGEIEADCTLRGMRTASTAFGEKTLLVWVEDAAWVDPPGATGPVFTQAMVDGLMDAFLEPDSSDQHKNDIYNWVTAICGEEWGETSASNLIGDEDLISIVVYDIEGDESENGGIMGYFWGGNNFTGYGSNEAILFALDSYLTAVPDQGEEWSADARWFKMALSTLAHEFQHMISFYQRQVLSGLPSLPTFVEEMLSENVEDLVASRLLVPGPRDVELLPGGELGTVYDFSAGVVTAKTGRLQLLNLMLNEPIATGDDFWRSPSDNARLLANYSQAFGFGAWYIRNYGGPSLYKAIYENASSDIEIIGSAARSLDPALAREGFWDYAGRWGAAIVLSDTYAATPYSLNKGGAYSWVVGGQSVMAGSINHFLYSYEGDYGQASGPSLITGTSLAALELKPFSNTYYLAGAALSGTHRWTIDGMDGVIVSVASKLR